MGFFYFFYIIISINININLRMISYWFVNKSVVKSLAFVFLLFYEEIDRCNISSIIYTFDFIFLKFILYKKDILMTYKLPFLIQVFLKKLWLKKTKLVEFFNQFLTLVLYVRNMLINLQVFSHISPKYLLTEASRY